MHYQIWDRTLADVCHGFVWDDGLNEWHDNRRIDVFNTYSVYNLKNELLHDDYYCKREDVIAFKPMPDVYTRPSNNKGESL